LQYEWNQKKRISFPPTVISNKTNKFIEKTAKTRNKRRDGEFVPQKNNFSP
jgi:hypothetical protein